MATHTKSRTATPAGTCLPYQKTGTGPALFLIHGWPFHAATFRYLVPLLQDHFTCYVIGSAGMCDEVDYRQLDMSFGGHADRLIQLADELGIERFSLLGHDTGGSIARFAAAKAPTRVERIVCTNTEVPHHRPPMVPFYQKTLGLPGAFYTLRFLMARKTFAHSSYGYKGLYFNPAQLETEGLPLYNRHWVSRRSRFNGMVSYLRGLDFNDIDTLADVHQQLKAPVMYVWGADDVTFEVKYARAFVARLRREFGDTTTQLVEISDACFLVHEEQPEQVAKHVISFLLGTPASDVG